MSLLCPSTCSEEQIREHYSEDGCRSRKSVKLAKRSGSCWLSYCRARKCKRRKVRLICNDGMCYTEDVDIVRKLACTKKYNSLFVGNDKKVFESPANYDGLVNDVDPRMPRSTA